MNILFATPYLPSPPNFGGARRMYELIRGARRLARVQTLSLSAPGEDISSAEEEIGPIVPVPMAVTARMAPDRRRRTAQLHSLASAHSFQYRLTHSARLQAALDELTARGDIDLVQFEFSQMGSYRLPESIPSVLDVHNIEHDVFRQMAGSGSLERRLFNQLEYRKFRKEEVHAWRQFSRCIATSSIDAGIIERQINRPVSVIPNGVDLDYFAATPLGVATNSHIVFTGAMRYRPNVDGVIWFVERILPSIQRELPAAHMTIVGADPTPAVRALGNRPGVTITGTVDDVRPWLRSAQVVVVPLLSGGGTRLKLLEAFASNRPVVSTHAGAEGIEVRHEQELLLADDAEGFSHAVIRLIQTPELCTRLTEAAIDLVRDRYQWSAISARLREVHQELIADWLTK